MKNFTKFLLISAALISQNAMAQQPGDLDSTFNANGINITNVQTGRDDEAYALAIQSNGMIVVAGYFYDGDFNNLVVARYKTDGTLDNGFSGNGIYTDLIGSNSVINAVAIQPDGKIVAAGTSDNNFLVIRLNSDGTIDTSFGGGTGNVTTDISGNSDYGYTMVLQSDGKIIVGGVANDGLYYNWALARYNSNGTLDNTFSTDGIIVDTIGINNSQVNALVIQSNGKIIAGGSSHNTTDLDFTLARYNADGTLDATFNTTGILISDLVTYDEMTNSLALQSDGKIIAAGYANNDSDDDFAVARYNSDGSLDNTFDTDGIQISDFFSDDEGIASVKIQQDGKIVATGYTYDSNNYLFALARYNNDGSLDNSFGGDGKVSTNLRSDDDEIYASGIQTDGKIVVAGSSYDSPASTYDFAVARYLTSTDVGILDFNSAMNSCLIFPNPVGDQTHLQYELTSTENISIQLFDVQGKLVYTVMENQKQFAGKHDVVLPFTNQMTAATYLLKIISDNGQLNIKLVKN